MCVLLVACCANAQTLGSNILYRKPQGKGPEIMVGNNPVDIQINRETNKIYVANQLSNSISIIDSDSGILKSIRVGINPRSIAIDELAGKIYVANAGSNSVTVIDGYNDSKIKDIPVGKSPFDIAIDTGKLGHYKIYVTVNNDTVSVINGNTDTKEHDIPVGKSPRKIAVGDSGKIYVANTDNDTVSVINGNTDTKEHDIPVGKAPSI